LFEEKYKITFGL